MYQHSVINETDDHIKTVLEGLPKDTVIAEFAGRDSVAAILKALERNDINNILPIVSFSPTEYGDINNINRNYHYLKNRCNTIFSKEKKIFPLIKYSNFDIWKELNKDIYMLIKKYGFYSPCIACHLYFHLLKLPFANIFSKNILSGERFKHSCKEKINQTKQVLDNFKMIIGEFNVKLITPIEDIDDTKEIKRIIGKETWEEGAQHLACVFSGNYRDVDGKIKINPILIQKYIYEYLEPKAISIGHNLIMEGKKWVTVI